MFGLRSSFAPRVSGWSDSLLYAFLHCIVFVQNKAPSEGDLRRYADSTKEWFPKNLLDKVELELVCTLHWWSEAGTIAPPWSKKLAVALEHLRAGLGKDSAAASETRRVACFEALCQTTNALMSSQAETSSQAGSTPSRVELPLGGTSKFAGAGAAAAPFSDSGLPPSDGHNRARGLPPSLRHNDEGVRGEAKAATGDGVGGTGIPVPADDGSSRTGGVFNRAISKGENDVFRSLFTVVHATPRKIKRAVNV